METRFVVKKTNYNGQECFAAWDTEQKHDPQFINYCDTEEEARETCNRLNINNHIENCFQIKQTEINGTKYYYIGSKYEKEETPTAYYLYINDARIMQRFYINKAKKEITNL